jgi:ribose/xylose/arabinose/galactoside ABC-type transport system permease subunit
MAASTTEPALDPTSTLALAPRRRRLRAAASPLVHSSATFIAFLLIFAVYAIWLGSKFLSTDARFLDVHQNVPILVLALAVMVTLVAGQFDLSVASMATLTSFLSVGLVVNQHWSFGLVIVACLAVGLVGGAVNGLLVVRLRVNTFIATLATGGIFGGVSKVYSKGVAESPSDQHPLPAWFAGPHSLGAFAQKVPAIVAWVLVAAVVAALLLKLRRARPAGLPARAWDVACGAILGVAVALGVVLHFAAVVHAMSWTILVLLVIATAMWVLLDHTSYGRYVHATGYNPEAARLTGVATGKETFKAFAIGGVLAAVAGVLLTANQGSAAPDAAATFLLPAFAAAFLSTVVLSTGRFTVWGAVVGGTFLVWVSQGLIVGGLPFTWTDVVNGVVLASAVAMSTVLRRRTG